MKVRDGKNCILGIRHHPVLQRQNVSVCVIDDILIITKRETSQFENFCTYNICTYT